MTTNAAYNWFAPEIEADANQKIEVAFPTTEAKAVEAAATVALSIVRQVTVVDFGTLAAAMTVTATVASHVAVGAILHVKAKSDTTARDITFSTGFTSPALAGVISKTKVMSFVWNGTAFHPLGASLQLD